MTKNWRAVQFFFAVTLALPLSSGVVAQDFDGQSFKFGETDVTPELRLDFVSIDNAYNTNDNLVSNTGVVASPSVNWKADRRLLAISATYNGKYGSFSESNLNFADHGLAFRVNALPAKRHRTSAAFKFNRIHEEIGTGQSVLVTDQQDQIVVNNTSLEAQYTFGARAAKGNLGGGLTIGTQTYSGDESIIRGDDNSTLRPYAFFSYRISPDTRLRAEVRYSILDYDEDRRDRSETAFLVGLDLAPAARTGGSLRIGVSNASYDTAGISDRSQLIADIKLYYRIRAYSRLNLAFNRKLETVDADDTGAGESLVDTAVLSWNHSWSQRISSSVRLGLNLVDRDCPNIDTSTRNAGFSMGTKIRRWLTLGAGVNSKSRVADLCNTTQPADSADFEQVSYSVFVKATL